MELSCGREGEDRGRRSTEGGKAWREEKHGGRISLEGGETRWGQSVGGVDESEALVAFRSYHRAIRIWNHVCRHILGLGRIGLRFLRIASE